MTSAESVHNQRSVNQDRPKRMRIKRKMLTADEECELASICQDETRSESERKRARDELIVCNMGLVYKMARGYVRGWDTSSQDDLVQEGLLGVYRATETFEVGRGLRFTTYCFYWIRAKITRYLQTMRKESSLPIPGAGMATSADGRRQRPRALTASLDAPVFAPDGAEYRNLVDMLEGGFECPAERMEALHERGRVHRALDDITRQSRDPRMPVIIRERLLADEPATLDEIGRLVGVSREGARLIEKRIHKSMRAQM